MMTGRGRGRGRGQIRLYLNIDQPSHGAKRPNGVALPQQQSPPKHQLIRNNIFRKSVASIMEDNQRKEDRVVCQMTAEMIANSGSSNSLASSSAAATTTATTTRPARKVKVREWDRGKMYNPSTGMWHT